MILPLPGHVAITPMSPGAHDTHVVQSNRPRSDNGSFSSHVEGGLHAPDTPGDIAPINIAGRRPVSPEDGFGQLWCKTYQIRLAAPAPTPETLIAEWKANFDDIWPPDNRFHLPHRRMPPGKVAAAQLTMPGGVKLATGLLIVSEGERSFTMVTSEGHMFAGAITFSARSSGESTIASVQAIMRAYDPIYELGLMWGGQRIEDRFWGSTLRRLAAHFGQSGALPTRRTECLDRHRHWRRASNIWYNAAVRTTLYRLATPFRWLVDRRAGERARHREHQ